MARFLDPNEFRLIRTGDTELELRICEDEVYSELEPRRLFPRTDITQYISLLNKERKEVAIIQNLEQLDADSREALLGCLDEYYMIPKITALRAVTEKYGMIKWHTETDRGPRTFQIKSRRSDIKILGSGKIIIRDSNDNRYEIEDPSKLDKHSRRLLFNET